MSVKVNVEVIRTTTVKVNVDVPESQLLATFDAAVKAALGIGESTTGSEPASPAAS